jgi:hypothetical protein
MPLLTVKFFLLEIAKIDGAMSLTSPNVQKHTSNLRMGGGS